MGLNEIIKIGNRMKELRIAKGLSQKDAANKLGLAYTTYSNYENNNREPSVDTLEKIANFYNVSVDYLLGIVRLDINIDENIESEPTVDTLAAHFDGQDFTDEELKEIMNFVEFVKNKRKDN